MGIYVRKSVKAGPFRFNVSGSGLGVSVGVPGFRVGTGPRGNYVHLGRNGIYYRASLGESAPRARPAAQSPFDPNAVVLDDVTGATTLTLEPTSGDDVVAQLNAAGKAFRWAWVAVAVAVVVGAVTMPLGVAVWVLAAPLCWWLFLWDASRRRVVLFYDVQDQAAQWFEEVVGAWPWLEQSQRLWRTVASGAVHTPHQHKLNAGASSIVRRVDATASLSGPKHLATNVAVPTIAVGNAGVHFLPDRLIVRDGAHYTDVSYSHLLVHGHQQRFIESGNPPQDASQVDRTWQYVNKSGGPDRRFANNRQLPVMLYSELHLRSQQGLSWEIQCSRAEAGTVIARVLKRVPLSADGAAPADA